ncbi:hypothetical protein [Dysgonomonas reticulitermitis]
MKTIQIEDKTIAVWFSCGAASAVAAKLIIDKYKESNTILLVNNPIKEEHHDNLRFKDDIQNWLDHPIIEAKNKDFPNASIVEVFDKRKYMSGNEGACCTMLLKKEARYQFELQNEIDFHVLGFTHDELNRHIKFTTRERSNVIPALIDGKYTKQDCFNVLINEGIEVPLTYRLGLPNANCLGCVKATSPTYWNLIRKLVPEVYEERASQSRCIGCKLVRRKGQRIFLDELKPTDKGGKLKSYECSIFCDM